MPLCYSTKECQPSKNRKNINHDRSVSNENGFGKTHSSLVQTLSSRKMSTLSRQIEKNKVDHKKVEDARVKNRELCHYGWHSESSDEDQDVCYSSEKEEYQLSHNNVRNNIDSRESKRKKAQMIRDTVMTQSSQKRFWVNHQQQEDDGYPKKSTVDNYNNRHFKKAVYSSSIKKKLALHRDHLKRQSGDKEEDHLKTEGTHKIKQKRKSNEEQKKTEVNKNVLITNKINKTTEKKSKCFSESEKEEVYIDEESMIIVESDVEQSYIEDYRNEVQEIIKRIMTMKPKEDRTYESQQMSKCRTPSKTAKEMSNLKFESNIEHYSPASIQGDEVTGSHFERCLSNLLIETKGKVDTIQSNLNSDYTCTANTSEKQALDDKSFSLLSTQVINPRLEDTRNPLRCLLEQTQAKIQSLSSLHEHTGDNIDPNIFLKPTTSSNSTIEKKLSSPIIDSPTSATDLQEQENPISVILEYTKAKMESIENFLNGTDETNDGKDHSVKPSTPRAIQNIEKCEKDVIEGKCQCDDDTNPFATILANTHARVRKIENSLLSNDVLPALDKQKSQEVKNSPQIEIDMSKSFFVS